MGIDLTKTTSEARKTYYAVLDDIGVPCVVDGTFSTKVLYKDFERPTDTLLENSKTASFKLDVPIKLGSSIEFSVYNQALAQTNIMKGICFSIPNQDPVSTTATILMYNSEINRERIKRTFNVDRTIKGENIELLEHVPVYIERISYSERVQDVGIESELTVRIITHKDYDLKIGDIIVHGNQRYLLKDIDNIKRTETLTCFLSPRRE